MATFVHLKKLFLGNSSDETVEASVVKEKNAQIGDEILVDGVPVYQDGNGAPVEQMSPLGYHVGWAGILFLNVSQMVGTGVFSTRTYSLNVNEWARIVQCLHRTQRGRFCERSIV
jgi:hypothetical protein